MTFGSPTRICLVPRLSGVGGMVTFQGKLAAGLDRRGVQAGFDLSDPACQAALVTGGTRQLGSLWRAKRRGVRVVQRLDGMNWLHRRRRTGLRHFVRAEYGNWLLAFIRARLADGIVYQSRFVLDWWERKYGRTGVETAVIYNGVDLKVFSPGGEQERPEDRARLLLVEGSLMGGYELGLINAVELAAGLSERLASAHSQWKGVELTVVGRVAPGVRARAESWLAARSTQGCVKLIWAGLVPASHIPEVDRSSHLLYSADLNAACPNSVVEALACGTPVIAFDTGALPEMVSPEAGRIVPYGGDPWRLDSPDIPALVEAAFQVLVGQERFRAGARARAEAEFGLDRMVDRYMEILTG